MLFRDTITAYLSTFGDVFWVLLVLWRLGPCFEKRCISNPLFVWVYRHGLSLNVNVLRMEGGIG